RWGALLPRDEEEVGAVRLLPVGRRGFRLLPGGASRPLVSRIAPVGWFGCCGAQRRAPGQGRSRRPGARTAQRAERRASRRSALLHAAARIGGKGSCDGRRSERITK